MNIDIKGKSPKELYSLFTQCIIPRPIAWVLSDNGNETYNLAPFSYFTGLSTSPPLICMSVGKKPNKEPKDTLKNIQERRHFVLHIPSVDQAQLVSDTAEHLEFQESEIEKNNIELVYDDGHALPRMKNTNIAFYGHLHQVTPVADTSLTMIIGEVTDVYVSDDCISSLDPEITIDPQKVNPLARLGGPNYAGLGDVFSINRK